MAKLSTAREARMYGPRPVRNRWEYINAGIYVFATILLVGGFAAQFSPGRLDDKSGLVLLLVAIALVVVVNAHDFVAHMAGIHYCVSLVQFDLQLGLVEFAVPLVLILGSVLSFVGILFFFIQMEKGYNYRLEKHALNLLIAGPLFWLVGSIHNICQVYERANGHVQILQSSVQIPFLMGSLMFLVAGILNKSEIFATVHHEFKLLGKSWIWLSVFGSFLFFVGGMLNVLKVFKMQQMDGARLEKLRGGALERLIIEREGTVPLVLEDNRRRRRVEEDAMPSTGPSAAGTPYKDVLVGGGSQARASAC